MSLESKSSVEIADLVHPLSVEAVAYFARTELRGGGWRENDSYNFKIGKFVRLGSRIYLGSTIDYGTDSRNLQHWQIARYAYNHLGLEAERMREQLEDIRPQPRILDLADLGLLLDAGSFVAADTDQLTMVLSDKSGQYGKADEYGRQQTEDIARSILGDEVKLIVRP